MKSGFRSYYRASALAGVLLCALSAQAPARKKLLIIGEEKGYRHDAVSHAMASIDRLGKETGLWDSVIVPGPGTVASRSPYPDFWFWWKTAATAITTRWGRS